MPAVWYIGQAARRTVSTEDWASYGEQDRPAVTWDQENGWSVDQKHLTTSQLQLLDNDPLFIVGAPAGFRTGMPAGVDESDTPSKGWVVEQIVQRQGERGTVSEDNPTGGYPEFVSRDYVDAVVPPLVTKALSTDAALSEAASSAAGAAVSKEIAGRELVETTDDRLAEHGAIPGVSFAVLDKRGNRTRIETDAKTGGPTDFSLSLDGPALQQYMDFLTGSDSRVPVLQNIPGLSAAVTDARGRLTWLRADDVTGGPPPETVEIIRESLALEEPGAKAFITAGDSITQGGHGGGKNWQVVLSELMGGVPVINTGVSGCTAIEIALKQGSWAPVITVTGGVLPAEAGTRVPVTLDNMPTAQNWWSATTQPTRTYQGTFEGIPAVLTKHQDNTWTLHRTANGTALVTIARTPFLVTPTDPSATWILWPGRNDYPKSNLREPLNRMTRWIRDGGGDFLILSTLTRMGLSETGEDAVEVLEQNRITQEDYPREFVNVREYMIRSGIQTAGLTPTAEDLTAIGKGAIPPALMADGLHPNAAGRLAIGTYVYQQLKARNLL